MGKLDKFDPWQILRDIYYIGVYEELCLQMILSNDYMRLLLATSLHFLVVYNVTSTTVNLQRVTQGCLHWQALNNATN
jgi:hypothetical protein